MIQNVDVDKMGNVLKELEKYEKIFDKVSGLITRLDKTGILPAILRIAGQKSGIENIDAPLPQKNPLSIDSNSPAHLMMFQELNKLSPEQIQGMYKQALEAEMKKKTKK